MFKDFKKFIMRGNVVDLAVAVVIGGAFGRIVSSFVNDIIMPLIGVALGNVDLTNLKWVIEEAQGDVPELAVNYGMFIQNIVDFLIIAFAIFLVIQFIEKSKKKKPLEPEKPAEPSADIQLLSEIRDLLKANK